jgi:hypothetical protein
MAAANAGGEPTTHRISAVTPLPSPQHHRPGSVVLADTWVELLFEDESGNTLPPIRRSVNRTAKGKLQEISPDFTPLQVDPIALKLGTVMPGLLSLIRVGSASELGKAVSQLTGLSALVELAGHVRRAKAKINGDLTKTKRNELIRIDGEYRQAKSDLAGTMGLEKVLAPTPPEPSDDASIELALKKISEHYESAKALAFHAAREVLGQGFDPASPQALAELERNIGGAIERCDKPLELPSAKRLGEIKKVTPEQLTHAEQLIKNLLEEGATLQSLAENPTLAARQRLYAHIATWMSDHPEAHGTEDCCHVCGAGMENAVDPITGVSVSRHLLQAHKDAELLAFTVGKWAKAAQAKLLQALPEALRTETVQGLPAHPCDLLRAALVDELFAYDPFSGVLAVLKTATAEYFDQAVLGHLPLPPARAISLPEGCQSLEQTLRGLDTVLRFARWRGENGDFVKDVVLGILSRQVEEDGVAANLQSLRSKLFKLYAIVKAATPMSEALKQCGRLKKSLEERRRAEARLKAYAIADQALDQIADMGRLADEQVTELLSVLSGEAAAWRDKIYLGAFPGTAHALIDTPVGRNGELGLMMQVSGVSAPAEYVSNASALRASLVAFYFAFRQYVLDQRGGIVTLLLDDPQELLDDENRDRLAAAMGDLVGKGAQLVATSYDSRFCARMMRLSPAGGLSHLAVHPATELQPVLRLSEPMSELSRRREHLARDPDDEEAARNFADACRIFLEARLGDIFDDPAYSAWVVANRDPTLFTFVQRLHPLVKAGAEGMFNQQVFRRFVEHPAFVSGSPVTSLMNKAHHGRRSEIRAADVAACGEELNQLLELAEEMYDECLRWKKRDPVQRERVQIAPLRLTLLASADRQSPIPIYPSLAASTRSGLGGSQEPAELLDGDLLQDKTAFVLRRPNFGFAAPAGSIAIVEALEGPVEDRRLVIARTAQTIYARRLVRAKGNVMLGLTADIPDPRTKAPKTVMIAESEVALHRVVGILFDHSVHYQPGPEEAVPVEMSDLLKKVTMAFRVVDQSAVPLALEKQVVLGGEEIGLSSLGGHEGSLVAVALEDGSSHFKRIGAALPGNLNHLRQFESIGGLGASQIFAVGKPCEGILGVLQIRAILGVLYNA